MDTFLSILVGMGLSAACGFRVFVPLLGMSIASISGQVELAQGFEWIGTWPALISFSVATLLEVGAYYIPWIDNLMDTMMTPLAIAAGTLLTASTIGEMSPFLKWSLALIAGGGISAIVQLGTVAIRAASSSATGGLANPIFSTLENISSIFMTLMAILLPLFCIFAVIWICYKMIVRLIRAS